MGYGRGGRKCIDSKAGDADLWIKIWKELHLLTSREILVEVEHAKAHRTEKDKREMWHFGKFVTDGNEKADELAKAGAMLDDGFMAQVRANTLQLEREEVYVALQYVASFHCLVKDCKDCEERLSQKKMEFHGKRREGTKHRMEWCAASRRYGCVRCGRGSKYTMMQGKYTGPKYMAKNLGRWRK